jgi:hypothetical protein
MPAATKNSEPVPTQTDWKRLRSMTDEDIARAVAGDPDAAPIPTESDLKVYKPAPARARH